MHPPRLTVYRHTTSSRDHNAKAVWYRFAHLIIWPSVVFLLVACTVPATVRIDSEKLESVSVGKIGIVFGYEYGSVGNMYLAGPIHSRVTDALEESLSNLALATISDQLISKRYDVEVIKSGYLAWHLFKHGEDKSRLDLEVDYEGAESDRPDAYLFVQIRVSPRLFGIGNPGGGLFYERDIEDVTPETFWPKVGFSEARLVEADTGDVLFYREKAVGYPEHRKDPIQHAYAELLDLSEFPPRSVHEEIDRARQ